MWSIRIYLGLPVNLSNYSTRITYGNDICRNVLGHDRACAKDCAVAYRHSWQHNHIRPNPATITDVDGHRISPPAILSTLWIPVGCQAVGQLDGMCGCCQVDARRNQHVVANGDAVAVDERAIEVDAHVRADVDVCAEAASEVIAHADIRADSTEQLFQHLPPFAALRIGRGIVSSTPL